MANTTLTAQTIESLLASRAQIEVELDSMGLVTGRDQRVVDRIKALVSIGERLALLGIND